MRTILIGRRHGKTEFELICGPTVNTSEQLARRADMAEKHPVNKDFAEVEIWDFSPSKTRLVFMSPAEAKAKAEADKDADEKFEAEQKARTEQIAKREDEEKAKAEKEHAAQVAQINKRVESPFTPVKK